jgi:excisionase family DNA binding protein
MVKLYDVTEVSVLLKVSKSYLYKLAERKCIGSIKIGSALRFNDVHIQKFLASCESASKSIDALEAKNERP